MKDGFFEEDDYWLPLLWQASLHLSIYLSIFAVLFILTLPRPYTPYHPGLVSAKDFSKDDEEHAERSGFALYQARKDSNGELRTETTVQIVVLGDIGRSPRMQYHALSIASHGGGVQLIGYTESEVHPDIQANRFISVKSLRPFPKALQTSNKLLFVAIAPLKIIWQWCSLYYALCYRTRASKWMLVQTPPSIPTLALAPFICWIRNTRLVIDWHNFGYSILAMKLGNRHPLVTILKWYERLYARSAEAHFAVTDAMTRVLKTKWKVEAKTLHDRPLEQLQPLSHEQKSAFLHRCPETAPYAEDIEKGKCRLVVSSTSWTPDEDFGILLGSLMIYSTAVSEEEHLKLPKLLVVITGKGPQKDFYRARIRQLNLDNWLQNTLIVTTWLSNEDYALLLGSADLGISLHTSSSGVDLPMKVVDMFGTGLPVAGWSEYEAWPELVQEGVNGRGFGSVEQLARILEELFSGDGKVLQKLRQGALRECDRRWNDEWMPVAGKLFRLK